VPPRRIIPWLREARDLLSAICGPQTGQITVTIHNDRGQALELLLPPDVNGRQPLRSRPADYSSLVVSRRLRPVERAALEAAENVPLPVKVLARKAGYRPGSYFSNAITQLCRLGKLVRVPDGLRRPGD
jgi:hypothetical protein